MATDKDREAEISARRNRLINEKPCFTISDRQIFLNLHNAATQKGAEKLQETYKIQELHDIFVNTGMSEDGRNVQSGKVLHDQGIINRLFSSKNGTYEVGLVLEYTDFKVPTEEQVREQGGDKKKAIYEVNKEGFKKLKEAAFRALKEYFKYFADTEAKEEKMVEFIPDYNGERIKI